MNRTISALIAVRSGSMRVKNKNLRDFNGRSLLELKIEQLKKIDDLDQIVVNSNCDEMLEVAEKNIPTTQKAVEQAEENLRVNEERYKAQVTTITEVLDAQALLTRARVNYYRSLYDQNLARARLERAIGAY